jgi:hypothetical protein
MREGDSRSADVGVGPILGARHCRRPIDFNWRATPDNDIVTYEVRERVAVVTMNRPPYRNAQNSSITCRGF